MNGITIHTGDCRQVLKTLPDNSVHCCVTSPPYWGLRDYGCDGQIGLEQTPDAFVAEMVAVFREVRRVLRGDGTCWLNLGDSYCNTDKWGGGGANTGKQTISWSGGKADCVHKLKVNKDGEFDFAYCTECGSRASCPSWNIRRRRDPFGLKPKDLVGIPWRVAFALQGDGWWLRQEIIWHKPAPMPESVTDRCTKAHEHIFLLTKAERYYFDAMAIAEEAAYGAKGSEFHTGKTGEHQQGRASTKPRQSKVRGEFNGKTNELEGREAFRAITETRNKRSVWTVATSPYKGAHFATFPPDLIRPCILAGTSEQGVCAACGAPHERVTERSQLKRERPNEYTKRTGEDGTGNSCANDVAGVSVKTLGWQPTCECDADVARPVVLDPFFGSGTTGQVARECGCECIGIDLNPEYVKLAKKRNAQQRILS